MPRFRTFTLASLSVSLMTIACGSAERPDPDEAFRRIQVHEATIAHRAAEAEACRAEAPCPAQDARCEAAEAICDLAEELDDADARARCALARRRCGRGSP